MKVLSSPNSLHFWGILAVSCAILLMVAKVHAQDGSASENAEERIKPSLTQEKQSEPSAPPKNEEQVTDDEQPPPGPSFPVRKVNIEGDTEFLESLDGSIKGADNLAEQFVSDLMAKEAMTLRELSTFCREFTRTELIEKRKYFLAFIQPMPRPIEQMQSDGEIHVKVHTDTLGEISFQEKEEKEDEDEDEAEAAEGTEQLRPYKGKFFSEKQIRQKLGLQEGNPFNYGAFYESVFRINSMPDLTLNGNLKRITDRKTVDVDFVVEEQLPLHGTLTVDNSGTEATDEWRAAATVQYLNVTKHFDVLSLDVSGAVDGSVYSGAGSYYFPFQFLDRSAAITAFGGYSTLEVDEIATGVDIESEGWFGGMQLQSELMSLGQRQLSGSLELLTRYTENQLLARGQAFPTDITIAPATLGLSYSENESDPFGGRNFLSYEFSINREGWLNSDDAAQFNLARTGATGDYTIHRLRASRIQRIWGKEGKWLLYLRANGQVADEPLVASEQFAMGGMNTVRGYEERVALTDSGANGTAELRTPLFDRSILGRETKNKPFETVQMLLFCDYAYGERKDVQVGEFESIELLGAGVGLRVSIAEHAQFRIDYGFALNDIEDEVGQPTDDGRVHVSIQAQF